MARYKQIPNRNFARPVNLWNTLLSSIERVHNVTISTNCSLSLVLHSARPNITWPEGANRRADFMIESVRNERAVAGFRLRERWIELSMGY